MSLKDWADVAQIVTTAALIIGVYQITINRKQLYNNTISRCIDAFRKIDFTKLYVDEVVVKGYVEILAEELFYIKNDYIPKDVAYEWIDGMIDFVPIWNTHDELLNPGKCIPLLVSKRTELLSSYPRIKAAFKVKGYYDFTFVYDISPAKANQRLQVRINIVEEIYNNVKYYDM